MYFDISKCIQLTNETEVMTEQHTQDQNFTPVYENWVGQIHITTPVLSQFCGVCCESVSPPPPPPPPQQQMQQMQQTPLNQPTQPQTDASANLVAAAQQVSAEAESSANSIAMLKSQAEQLNQQAEVAAQKAAKAQENFEKASGEAQQLQQQAQQLQQQAQSQEGMVNAKKQLANSVLSQVQQPT